MKDHDVALCTRLRNAQRRPLDGCRCTLCQDDPDPGPDAVPYADVLAIDAKVRAAARESKPSSAPLSDAFIGTHRDSTCPIWANVGAAERRAYAWQIAALAGWAMAVSLFAYTVVRAFI